MAQDFEKLNIQWFPGHMNAARRKAAETMEMTDLVIECWTPVCLRPAAIPWLKNCGGIASDRY